MEKKVFERRHAPRIATNVPIDFGTGRGITKNISTSGVCFITDAVLRPGEPLHFALTLEPEGGEEAVTLQCEGTVKRIELDGDQNMVFIALESFWFEPPAPTIPHQNDAMISVSKHGSSTVKGSARDPGRSSIRRKTILSILFVCSQGVRGAPPNLSFADAVGLCETESGLEAGNRLRAGVSHRNTYPGH